MDIHKPKSWHGLREFLKEYGIIVLGVLTALAFEQAVEALHWRHEVETERRALHGEVRANLSALLYRQSEQACIDHRLAEIAEVFRRQAHDQPLGLKGPVLRPQPWIESTGSWQIAVADQALSHMPLAEKLKFSDAFDAFIAYNIIREREDDAWRALSLLDNAALLTPADWATLHADYAEAQGLNQRIRQAIVYPLSRANMGERPAAPDVGPEVTANEVKFCQPML
ncbi:MAG TPA: hypothetical protein VGL66_07455 [Caulobacteraceae bacterium]|jgi:hypothetical protein